jgi:hypothetical protein
MNVLFVCNVLIPNIYIFAASLVLFLYLNTQVVIMYWFWYFRSRTLIVLFWIEWLQFLFTFTNKLFLLLLCFLITECDKGNFGEDCKSRCHCLNGEGCNNKNCSHSIQNSTISVRLRKYQNQYMMTTCFI